MDIRRLPPSDVISIALEPERQEQQNVRKLRGLSFLRWEALVNLIDASGHSAPIEEVCKLLDLNPKQQEMEAIAARANMTTVVKMLHDKSSQLLDKLIHALSKGKLCVMDVSQMRGRQSLILSGLILRRIFDRNQQEFTAAEPATIPTIAVVEEAQSVLHEKAASAEPYIAWVKEGRKYDLGALLITQQPGSIPNEILSQGDNWFIFHLLSSADLVSAKRANSHFSEDLLSSLLNEPIPGQGVFWSSVGGKPYPISLRVQSFENMYSLRDPGYNKPAGKTYAGTILHEFQSESEPAKDTSPNNTQSQSQYSTEEEYDVVDVMAGIETKAINKLRADERFLNKLQSEEGVAWGSVKAFFVNQLPENLDDRDQLAYKLVPKALNEILPNTWESFKVDRNGRQVTYVRKMSDS